MFVCMIVCEERERISVTLVTTAAQGCASDLCGSIHTTVFSPKEKETDKHECMHMHVCMHVPTAAQPHLKGV
jgi:hypothetical protein